MPFSISKQFLFLIILDPGLSKLANTLDTQLRVGRSVLASHGFAIGQSDSVPVLCTVLLSTSLYDMRPLSDNIYVSINIVKLKLKLCPIQAFY